MALAHPYRTPPAHDCCSCIMLHSWLFHPRGGPGLLHPPCYFHPPLQFDPVCPCLHGRQRRRCYSLGSPRAPCGNIVTLVAPANVSRDEGQVEAAAGREQRPATHMQTAVVQWQRLIPRVSVHDSTPRDPFIFHALRAYNNRALLD